MNLTGIPKPLKDYAFIRANPKQNAVKKIAPGVEIIIDQTWDPHAIHHVTQDGTVVYLPRGFSKEYKEDINYQGPQLEIGDHVYCHHFLCDKPVGQTEMDNDGFGIYLLLYGMIHCVIRDGNINMIGEWNLVDPIKVDAPKTEVKGLITQVNEEVEPLKGIARHINDGLRKLGIKEGDEIYFDADSDYEMIVEGQTYYRMENCYILGKANEKPARTESASSIL